MEKTIELKRKDYADYNIYVYFKKMRSRLVITVLGFALLFSFILADYSPFNIGNFSLTFILCLLGFGVVYPLLMMILLQFMRFIPSKGGSILGKRTFKISNEGLIEISNSNTNVQKWASVKSVESNHNAVYIFVDNVMAYILPNRYFKNQEEQTSFIKAIEEKINTDIEQR